MNEPRINASSIRYSDKVKDLINQAPGESFADRFEFLVLSHYEKIQDRKKELADLQTVVDSTRASLFDLTNQLKILHQILNNGNGVVMHLKNIEKHCNTFLTPSTADPAELPDQNVLQKEEN